MKKFFVSVVSAFCAVSLSAADSMTVKMRNGSLAGARGRDASIAVFRGIPYVAPPVGGKLRFAAPASPASWHGVRDATMFGANCPQNIVAERKPWTSEFMAHGTVSEDCLFLNVWTPALGAREKVPVYVFLHGGGFNEAPVRSRSMTGKGLRVKASSWSPSITGLARSASSRIRN